ncbi:carbohydrate ABC transporter permease [Lignipirellula cremea]|uniref:Lactose transport system permease protein LacF n=1 Tax=Lignipirellula cremea TaxID=2528010 RepID=A0A518DUV2_9BACT|nr:sugar ABC transporter permease [Lignipirellula cremea]QDU95615.1 Lactose transport system permease protein LacF [Lignipirellula cremea]
MPLSVRRYLVAFSFIAPWAIGFVALILFPFVATGYWSFTRYDMLSPPEWVGGHHYWELAGEILRGEDFGRALWNTAYYALLSVPLSVALGIALAVMLRWEVRGQAVFRTLFFLPSVAPVVASCVLWMWILDPRNGLLNYLLRGMGLAEQQWFASPQEALLNGGMAFGSKDGLVLMSLWGVGNFMVIYLAALGEVPRYLYEAAELDGAGPVRRFWHITLPMLSPVIFFNLVMGLIQSVQAFTQIYIVSEGAGEPAKSTLVLSLYLFLQAFSDLNMGKASAVAWILFLLLLVATAGLFRTSRRWVHYG